MSENRNILEFIRTLCANGESGRLEVLAGAIQGELSFAEGKLVDARVGHLTGFRAVNAVVAMRDARFSFDPTFSPLASGSITASERVVLRQFFGIEAVAGSDYLEPAAATWREEEAVPVVPINDTADEVTIVSSNVTSDESPSLPPPPVSRSTYRPSLAFAALAIALMATGAVLFYKFHKPAAAPVVASVESPARLQPAASPAVVAAVEPPARGKQTTPVKTEQDLSGKWTVVNTVESTSYGSFKNMKIGFDLSINQTGTSFTGRGYKVSENGRSLPASGRTPIEVRGAINGDQIEATFVEEGAARKSNGKFVWRMDRNGRGLTGSFATTAARSSGKSAAIRL
jgi:hypothetical protein